MQINAVPFYDASVNTTGCCPRFNPAGWHGRELHFDQKPFVRAVTRSLLHVPVNMGSVFRRMQEKIDDTGANDTNETLVLSRDLSPWSSEHLFAVRTPLADEESVRLSGDFVTKVFEGPYREATHWHRQMQDIAHARGATGDDIYFFYTTCPKCAESYGKNYVVGAARIDH